MMVKEEGLFRPLRGVNAMIAGAGPAHAMYFGCLETGKNFSAKFNLTAEIGDGKFDCYFIWTKDISWVFISSTGVSAVFATCLHDAVMTPAEGKIWRKMLIFLQY